MTRLGAIQRAIDEELRKLGPLIDSNDLRGFVLDVKLSPDTMEPRTVIFRPEFERQKKQRAS